MRGTLRQWLEAYGTGSWFGYLYLDATYLDVRRHGRSSPRPPSSRSVSLPSDARVLGMPVGDSESTDFWTEFLRSLRQRGLNPTRVTRRL